MGMARCTAETNLLQNEFSEWMFISVFVNCVFNGANKALLLSK